MLVAIGDNCIDRYLSPIVTDRVGGNAVNVAANLAVHGAQSAYAGVVGDDGLGSRIVKALRAVGVNTDFVSYAKGSTGITEIEVHGDDYTIVREDYGVSAQVVVTDSLSRFLKTQASRIHVTVSGEAASLLEKLRPSSLPVSIDLGVARSAADLERFALLLPLVAEAFFSAGSTADDVTVEAALRYAKSLGTHSVIATRGARGCSALLHDGRRYEMESTIGAGDIVDPLGAGDAFIAGFLHGVEGSAADALQMASAWAAQACRQIGGWSGAEL